MAIRPLLMMRGKGVFGPLFGRHHRVPGLSKSSGALTGGNLIQDPGFDTPDDGDPWTTTGGWTIAAGVAHNDGAVGTLSQVIA